MRVPKAVIIQDRLSSEFLPLIKSCLVDAGFSFIQVMNDFPLETSAGSVLIVDKQVGNSTAESFLQKLTRRIEMGVCVLVSPPYIEKVTRLKFGEVQLADMVVIKGPPEEPSHLDMFIVSTAEPKAVTTLFKRMRKSLAGEE